MTADLTLTTQADPTGQARRDRTRLRWVLLVALLGRLAVLFLWPDNLTDDRDGYLALADGLAAGRGFSIPETRIPTTYRPPLYPLMLVPSAIGPDGLWVALLHLALGLTTVWLSYHLAIRLTQRSDIALLAAVLVAVDPILLRYTTLPMTETLATCLVTALLVVIAGDSISRRTSLLSGLLFGLAALCRPTVWAFAGLSVLWMLGRWLVRRIGRADISASIVPQNRSRRNVWVMIAAAAIVLLPWGLRNWRQFGRPILMTTHGGYTLLLGNNPHFVREVVDQPWGTVWDGSIGGGQSKWAEGISRRMDNAGIAGELARDRWMRDRAVANILADPAGFARTCWLRLRRFWGLMPVEGARTQPAWMRGPIGLFYALTFAAAGMGLVHILRRTSPAWRSPLLMVAAFTGVHLIYWSNTRMRAPLVPVIAILAAIGWHWLLNLRARRSGHYS